ncbi:MAG TPA: D-2-hydroxyacid dehydrogenase family protein [Candidatus Acidoferrales bacterium]|jgi:phosphoglycerate dehydrogenase-like enzyme|nr:D-2-hydroxyacid dehydrogenase family protein [Candidatus Acidoferrales bacterium]
MIKRLAVLDDYQGAAFAQPYWKKIANRIELEGYRDTLHDEERIVERLKPYQILVPIRERTHFTKRVLEHLPNLELLSLTGKNSGQVDLGAATAQGILVTQTEGSGATAIEVTMALMLAMAHRVAQEDRAIREGLWQTGMGFDLAGKTLGVIGLGRIGSKIASFGNHLGMKVIAWSANLTAEKAAAAGAAYTPLDDLFRESDIITLHLRLSERTRGLVTARHISLMKPTACMVNTARGELMDENALVAALRDGRIRGAALDVFQTEPLPVNHPLRVLENVVLSPHMGYVSAESYDRFFRQAIDNVEAYLGGRVPAGAMNPEVLQDGKLKKKIAVI